jgi:putative ABC transport system permease protein
LPGEFDTPDSLSAIIVSSHQWVSTALADELDRSRRGVFGLAGQTPVSRDIRRVLGPIHGFDEADTEALSLWDTAVEAVMFSRMIRGMKEFFIAVSLITLALGGIGVMNIMLVAVRERTREIGLRKALGATPRLVRRQFIVEGLSLTLTSGVIGFVAGYAICQLINLAPLPARFSGMIVTPGTAAFAVAALTLIGVLAALYPAARAAALAPVEALRYDL